MRRVCVIGAGLAGIAAAEALVRAEHDVVVLEARGRVGGRVWSDRLETGALVERGGEFLTGGYEVTESVAERLGLRLVGMGIRYPDRELRPDPGIDRRELERAAVAVEVAASAAPDRPALAVLAETVADPAIREVLTSRVQSSRAHPIEDLSAVFLRSVSHLLATAEARRIEGGNDRIARELARRVPDVRLRTAVRAVRQDVDGVRVATNDGEVSADAVVVAVPVPLLRELSFDPPLPTATAAALASVRMSVAAKLTVPLRAPVSPAAVMSVPGRWWAYTTPCDEVGSRTVGAWAGSAGVVDSLLSFGEVTGWLAAMEELWPELELERSGALVSTWLDDPWSRGAYSVLERTTDGLSPFAAPHGRVAFAGEHTSPDWSATIEGALRSGLRAADDVCARLSQSTS